jgi:hypothetical protein
MQKIKMQLIELSKLIYENNSVEFGYPCEDSKKVSKNPIIFINGIRVFKKDLPSILFLWVNANVESYINYKTFHNQLAKQFLSDYMTYKNTING